jgi:hypothetical protein
VDAGTAAVLGAVGAATVTGAVAVIRDVRKDRRRDRDALHHASAAHAKTEQLDSTVSINSLAIGDLQRTLDNLAARLREREKVDDDLAELLRDAREQLAGMAAVIGMVLPKPYHMPDHGGGLTRG